MVATTAVLHGGPMTSTSFRRPSPVDPELVDAASRDLGLDAYRAFAMFVVVAWHWVFTIATWGDRGPRVDNPISHEPALGHLTWALQVMPLFFLVGGLVTARSLRTVEPSAVRSWTTRRLGRLVAPALPLLGALTAAYVVARGLDAPTVARAVVLVATPLWFLGVYVAILALVPVVQPLARRWPVGHVVGLGLGCVAWDIARFHGRVDGGWLWISMVTVWLTVHQAGGLLDRIDRRLGARLLGGGLLVLVVGTTAGPYPVSMVGTTTDAISNMGPPTAVLLGLGAIQLGLVALTRRWVDAVATRHPDLVDAAARHAMPVYLWHMVGFGTCVVLVTASGVTLPDEPTLGWWLARPLWVLGPALVALPLVRWSAARATSRRSG